jgi:hypothetical protein
VVDSASGASRSGADFWDLRVGPFYDAAGVASLTGLTSVELTLHTETDEVLKVETTDGTALFPSFQFGPRGELLPGLRAVTRSLLPVSDDRWDVAIWLNALTPRFHGRSAAEALRAGDVEAVIALAQRDGRILGH